MNPTPAFETVPLFGTVSLFETVALFEPVPLFGPVPGGMEMMIILLVAVLLFGANKLPKLARSTGAAMGEFKKGREQVEREMREAVEGVERDDATDQSLEDETANV